MGTVVVRKVQLWGAVGSECDDAGHGGAGDRGKTLFFTEAAKLVQLRGAVNIEFGNTGHGGA